MVIKIQTHLPTSPSMVRLAKTVVGAIPPNTRVMSLMMLVSWWNFTHRPAFTMAMSSSLLGDCLKPLMYSSYSKWVCKILKLLNTEHTLYTYIINIYKTLIIKKVLFYLLCIRYKNSHNHFSGLNNGLTITSEEVLIHRDDSLSFIYTFNEILLLVECIDIKLFILNQ